MKKILIFFIDLIHIFKETVQILNSLIKLRKHKTLNLVLFSILLISTYSFLEIRLSCKYGETLDSVLSLSLRVYL